MANPRLQFVLSVDDQGSPTLRKFVGELEKVEKTAARASTSGFTRLQASIVTLNQGFALAERFARSAGAALEATIGRIVAQGDQLQSLSRRLNLSASSLSSFGFAAKQAGVDLAELGSAFRVLSRNLVEAEQKGSNANKILVQGLGFTIAQLKELQRDPQRAVLALADAFNRYEDGARKSAAAQELFGRGGMAMLSFFKEGRGEIEKNIALAQRLGTVWRDEQVAAADRLGDAVSALGASYEGLLLKLAGSETLLNNLSGTVEGMAEAVGRFTENLDPAQVERFAQAASLMAQAFVDMGASLSGGILDKLTAYMEFTLRFREKMQGAPAIFAPWMAANAIDEMNRGQPFAYTGGFSPAPGPEQLFSPAPANMRVTVPPGGSPFPYGGGGSDKSAKAAEQYAQQLDELRFKVRALRGEMSPFDAEVEGVVRQFEKQTPEVRALAEEYVRLTEQTEAQKKAQEELKKQTAEGIDFQRELRERLEELIDPASKVTHEFDQMREKAMELGRADLLPLIDQIQATEVVTRHLGQVFSIVGTTITDVFEGLILGTRKVEDAFQAMALSILKQIAQIASQQVANALWGGLVNVGMSLVGGAAQGGAGGASGGWTSYLSTGLSVANQGVSLATGGSGITGLLGFGGAAAGASSAAWTASTSAALAAVAPGLGVVAPTAATGLSPAIAAGIAGTGPGYGVLLSSGAAGADAIVAGAAPAAAPAAGAGLGAAAAAGGYAAAVIGAIINSYLYAQNYGSVAGKTPMQASGPSNRIAASGVFPIVGSALQMANGDWAAGITTLFNPLLFQFQAAGLDIFGTEPNREDYQRQLKADIISAMLVRKVPGAGRFGRYPFVTGNSRAPFTTGTQATGFGSVVAGMRGGSGATRFGASIAAGAEASDLDLRAAYEALGITPVKAIDAINRTFDGGRRQVEFYTQAVQGLLEVFAQLPAEAAQRITGRFLADGKATVAEMRGFMRDVRRSAQIGAEALGGANGDMGAFTSSVAGGLADAVNERAARALFGRRGALRGVLAEPLYAFREGLRRGRRPWGPGGRQLTSGEVEDATAALRGTANMTAREITAAAPMLKAAADAGLAFAVNLQIAAGDLAGAADTLEQRLAPFTQRLEAIRAARNELGLRVAGIMGTDGNPLRLSILAGAASRAGNAFRGSEAYQWYRHFGAMGPGFQNIYLNNLGPEGRQAFFRNAQGYVTAQLAYLEEEASQSRGLRDFYGGARDTNQGFLDQLALYRKGPSQLSAILTRKQGEAQSLIKAALGPEGEDKQRAIARLQGLLPEIFQLGQQVYAPGSAQMTGLLNFLEGTGTKLGVEYATQETAAEARLDAAQKNAEALRAEFEPLFASFEDFAMRDVYDQLVIIAGILGTDTQSIRGILQGFADRYDITPRQHGGPIMAGRAYLVGERGPEVIVPQGSGTVIPNHALGGATVGVNIVVQATSNRPEDVADAVERAVRDRRPSLIRELRSAVG